MCPIAPHAPHFNWQKEEGIEEHGKCFPDRTLTYLAENMTIFLLKICKNWKVASRQAYFYLEVGSLFHLLGLLLRGSLDFVFLLISLQPPQLLLNAPPLLPHLLSVLLVEEGKLPSAATKTRVIWFFLYKWMHAFYNGMCV